MSKNNARPATDAAAATTAAAEAAPAVPTGPTPLYLFGQAVVAVLKFPHRPLPETMLKRLDEALAGLSGAGAASGALTGGVMTTDAVAIDIEAVNAVLREQFAKTFPPEMVEALQGLRQLQLPADLVARLEAVEARPVPAAAPAGQGALDLDQQREGQEA